MPTGEVKAGEVRIAEEVKYSESDEFFDLSNDVLDIWSAIVVVMCFSTFRSDGRIVLTEELLNSWNGYAEQRLADYTLVGSEDRWDIAAIRLSFDGGLDEWQWVVFMVVITSIPLT